MPPLLRIPRLDREPAAQSGTSIDDVAPQLANADLVSDPRRAGARAHLRAMGLSERDWAKPLVGIATTWTGTMPCNLGQRELARHVATGVREAGGTPVEFNTIAISDNLTQGMPGMRASLVSREVIADSIELVGRSQPFDGLVCLVGCDKTVPAAVMALVRLDVPALVLYSGAMGTGSHKGAPVTIQDVWEAVGAHEAGQLSDDELAALERDACPGIGACTGHFTANTMAVAVDFLGLGPAGLGGVPAADPAKPAAAVAAGRFALDVIARGARPSSFVTREGLENAIVGVTGTGGSTNAVIHLLAIADEAGVELTLDDFDRLSASTPVVTSLTPGGRYVAGDLHRVGGTPTVMKRLREHLHTAAPTVDGRTLGEIASSAAEPDGAVVALFGALQAARRDARPARQPRARRRGPQARRARAPRPPRAGSGLRVRVRLQGRGLRRSRPAGRCRRRAGRGACRRAGHARDAVDHLRDRRPRARRLSRARHRRPLQRRDARARWSATSRPRLRTGARSGFCATEISSRSTWTTGGSTSSFPTQSSPSATRPAPCPRHVSCAASSRSTRAASRPRRAAR